VPGCQAVFAIFCSILVDRGDIFMGVYGGARVGIGTDKNHRIS